MKEKRRPTGDGAYADEPSVRPVSAGSSGITFRIERLQRVQYGSKRATFVVQLDGIATIEADLFQPADRDAFVMAGSVRDKFSGGWIRRTRFDKAFAADILAAVLARLDEEATP